MAKKSVEEITELWAARLGAAVPQYISGVMAVTEAPGKKAAAAAQRMVQNLQAVVASGEYARRAESVSLSEWQNSAVEKGSIRIGQGAEMGRPKFNRFMTQFLPHVEAAVAKLPARGSKEQNRARMNSMFDANSKFKLKK